MIKLILFDYDGVIVDSFQNVYEVYSTICKKLGKKFPEGIDEFKKIYGNSSSECYNQLGFSEEERIKGNIIFKEEILKKNPSVFKGIPGLLEELHRTYKLVLLSSSYREEVEQKLTRFGIMRFFDHIIAKENHIRRFEKTEPITSLLKKLGLRKEEALLIGDRNIDFIEGAKAGLKNILLVDYGWGYDPEPIPEYKPRSIIKKPEDILTAVKKY